MAQCSHYVNSPSPTSRLPDAEKTEGRPSSACRRRVSYLPVCIAAPLICSSLSHVLPQMTSYLDHVTFPLRVPS